VVFADFPGTFPASCGFRGLFADFSVTFPGTFSGCKSNVFGIAKSTFSEAKSNFFGM